MFWCIINNSPCISTVYIFDNLVFILTKSHLGSYPCPLNINFYWNMGFTLGIVIVVQIVTGLFISFHYSSDINEAYYSVFFLIREIYYGWSLRFLHSSGASFVFLFVFLHIGRSLFYGSFFYNPNTWFSGILILLLLMGIAFLGYVLPFGQMSFWGATVITNLLSPFPCLFVVITSHEWYFLCQYAMLKAVPNKNAGFIILLTSILSLFLFGEIRNLSTFIKFMDCKNGFSITFFFLLSVCILWIGAQFPQEIYLSYARILTLHYYCSLFICILLTLFTLFSSIYSNHMLFWEPIFILR